MNLKTVARRLVHGSVAVSVVAVLSGCGASLIDIDPPGTGSGDGAYEVVAEFEDALGVPSHGIVKQDGLQVGEVTKVAVDEWHAELTLSLRKDVAVPANTVAAIRQNSPLGETFIALDTPQDPSPQQLQPGDRISLERTKGLVAVEDVLALMGTVTNGAALDNLQTIATTITGALDGHAGDLKSAMTRADNVLAGLVQQRSDLDRLLVGMDTFTKQVVGSRDALVQTMENLAPVVREVAGRTDDIVAVLAQVRRLSRTSMQVIDATGDNIVTALVDAGPVLRELRNNQASMREMLLKFLEFAPLFRRASPGDYTNVKGTLTLSTLRKPGGGGGSPLPLPLPGQPSPVPPVVIDPQTLLPTLADLLNGGTR